MFIFIQEHWLPNCEAHDTFSNAFPNYNFITTSADTFTQPEDKILEAGPVWHGTALGWEKKINDKVTKIPIASNRFCGVKFSDQNTGVKIALYSVYLPTSGKDDEFIEVTAHLSADLQANVENDEVIIIGIDSNQSMKSTRRRSKNMNAFVQMFSLQHTFDSPTPTFHHQNQTSTSKIDDILYFVPSKTSAVNVKFMKHLCTLEHSSNLSSHDVILGNISISRSDTQTPEKDYSDSYTNFTIRKPVWQDTTNLVNYQHEVSTSLDYIVNIFDGPEFLPIMSELMAKALVTSAENTLVARNQMKVKKQQKVGPYFTKEQKEAYSDHELVCKEWRKAGRPSSPNHPMRKAKLDSQRKLQRINREVAVSKSEKLHEDLISSANLDINLVFKKMKTYLGKSTGSTDIPYIETLNGVFSGQNVLEGFCRNTETLCQENKESTWFKKLCEEDNIIINDLLSDAPHDIPEMTLDQLKDILFKKLKTGKACDAFKLTVEHLRYCSDDALVNILFLINGILKNINYLCTHQLNTSIASIVYKGKEKPVCNHKSYRQVRVSPLFTRIIDEFLRPNLLKVTKPIQNTSQYGFTENVSYMMAALQRHEAEKYCVDNKFTFFGCSLDGESAFEVVDRNIQLRELYFAGESGRFWLADKFMYKDTLTQIKMHGNLSRSFAESAGVKQGNCKSSDHYKIYVNPLLNMIDQSQLGIWIGPINVAQSACADDEYLMTDSQHKLQILLDVADHYGKLYNVTYGAAKTKVTIIGSTVDRQYFKELAPWHLNGQTVNVTEDNDHLGQVVSGVDQEIKNVDIRIRKGRHSLFALLGPAFQNKCHISPLLKHHLLKTYISPIIRSGLSSFSLTTNQLKPLAIFHRKVLRGILNLSKSSNIPALHFLLGEMPIEGQIHRDLFSLFYNVWSNPDSKIYAIVKYLLEKSTDSSRTWSNHVKFLSKRYQLENPSQCLKRDPPKKSEFKELILTSISNYYESELRTQAKSNSRMQYLNVSLLSLRGRPHPALQNIKTTHDVRKSRPHIKMLSGDYFTYQIRATQSGGSAHCRCCNDNSKPNEDIQHIIMNCSAYEEIRQRLLNEIKNLCQKTNHQILLENLDSKALCQFLLDPSSMNLKYRISMSDPFLSDFSSYHVICVTASTRKD